MYRTSPNAILGLGLQNIYVITSLIAITPHYLLMHTYSMCESAWNRLFPNLRKCNNRIKFNYLPILLYIYRTFTIMDI